MIWVEQLAFLHCPHGEIGFRRRVPEESPKPYFFKRNEEFRYVCCTVSTRSTMTKGNRVMQPPHCLHDPLVVEGQCSGVFINDPKYSVVS